MRFPTWWWRPKAAPLIIWQPVLISTCHDLLISTCRGLLISTQISTDELITRPELINLCRVRAHPPTPTGSQCTVNGKRWVSGGKVEVTSRRGVATSQARSYWHLAQSHETLNLAAFQNIFFNPRGPILLRNIDFTTEVDPMSIMFN